MAEFDDLNFGGFEQFESGGAEPLGDRFKVSRALRAWANLQAKLDRSLRQQEDIQIQQACKRLLYAFWKKFDGKESP